MRATNPIEPVSSESALPKSKAKVETNVEVKIEANVYDLGLKQDESSRLRRIRDLEHENALLMRMVSDTQIEIAQLRELLASK
jgi:hypothetical protein